MKQYSASENVKLQSRSGFMSEVEFWYIIKEAKESTPNGEALAAYITGELSKRNIESILGFDYWFTKFYYHSYTPNLWCAAYVAKGECDDDGFDYFRAWLIGQGQQVYEAAISDPDSLADALETTRDKEITSNEALLIAAARAYEAKTGKNIEAFYEVLDDYETDFGSFRTLKFNWQPNDPGSMKNVCPKVFERFWGREIR